MTIKELGQRLITSSADPKKVGLAAKGVTLLIGSQIVRALDIACSFGVTCLAFGPDQVNLVAEAVDSIVYGTMLVVGGVWFLVGLGRKAYLGQWNALGK